MFKPLSIIIKFPAYLCFKRFLPRLWRQRCQAFHLIRQIFQLFSISLCFPCIGMTELKGTLPEPIILTSHRNCMAISR